MDVPYVSDRKGDRLVSKALNLELLGLEIKSRQKILALQVEN